MRASLDGFKKLFTSLIQQVDSIEHSGGSRGFHWFPRKPLSKVKIILIPIFMQQLKTYLKHTLYCYTTIPNQLSALLTTEYEQLSL